MTVLEQDDDDMPPLEYVGTGAVPAPKTAPLAPTLAEEEDDDDDMPPLDYVGLTPGKAQEPEKIPKAAPPPAEVADDDMPPLEYIGTGPGQSYCLREGSKVRLKGLSKADLNGQTGTILPFLNTTKDRLPVCLDSSGKNVSIKPDNLEKVDAGPELTPEPRVGDEDSDNEMPPLNVAPAPNPPAPKGDDTTPAAPEEEEDDDDMPPLEHVGVASPAAAPLAAPAPAPVAAPAPVEDDDDDMPPLEYVGTSSAPAKGPSQPLPAAVVGTVVEEVKQQLEWKEGDQVRLKGLSKTDLNGQTGRILSFTGTCPDRLPLKLDDSGKKVAIKVVNMERLTPPAPQVEDDDDDMPPLEYVGSAANGTSASNLLLEAPAAKPAAPAAAAEDDEDDMPPLEFVGTQPKASTQEDADDDMPLLEYVGTAKPSATPSFQEGDKVILKGLSKVELNGQRGRITSIQGSAKDRLPVSLDTTQQRLSVKPENLELAREREEDDEMPPLTYVGVGSAEAPSKPPVEEDDDEDDMPPLEYVGALPGKGQPDKDGTPVPPLEQESDDDMPPLEYVGTSGPEHTGPARRPAEKAPESTALAEEEEDDDMPPLEYVGTQQPQPSQVEDDDDMPPLEYVGSSSARPLPGSPGFKEGDVVVLNGLSKAELNGQQGVVMAFSGEGQGGRLPVRLEASGQKVSIKPANLERRSSAQPGLKEQPEDSEDDDDMPPLEYVGSAALPQVHVGVDAGESVFREGDAVVLKGLAKANLNGQHGTVLPFLEKANGRLPVRLASGEKVSIKPENLEKTPRPIAAATEDGAMSDDSMPPLDYVGTAAPTSQEASSRPPLLPQSPGEEEVLRLGDTVVLSGLRTTDINGERAKIVKEPDAAEPRVQLKLLGSGKKLLVKWANIIKAPNSESEEEEVSKRSEATDVKASASRVAETSKTPEELLELMRQAMQSTAVAPVVDALAQVEAAEGLDWGDLLPRKKHTLKKLRAKKKKLQPQDDEPAQQPPDTPERPPLPPAKGKATSGSSSLSDKATGRGEQDKNGKRVEEDWVVLSGAASPSVPAALPTARLIRTAEGPKAAPPSPPTSVATVEQKVSILKQWCQDLQLPMEVLKVLEAEEVTDPQELTDVSEEELSQLTKGWKIGPKGRFMKAVRKMRALEQAEYGSTCGSLA